MKNILNECIERIRDSRRTANRYLALLVVLALLTALAVNWSLRRDGISMTADYVCGIEEHTHTDDCYALQLTCGQDEAPASEGHTHTEDCYTEQQTLNCAETEHTHGDDCYDENGELTCTLAEHTHTDSCYLTERVLTCGQEEAPASEGHTHTDACYTSELVCGKQEHTHSLACLITDADSEPADSAAGEAAEPANSEASSQKTPEDETAGETGAEWEAALPELSGIWPADLANVAQSQLGYTPADGQTPRYTLWYGDSAETDWSCQFISFCLHYAGVDQDTLPTHFDSLDALQNADSSYFTQDTAAAAEGDVAVYKTDSGSSIGIVTKDEDDGSYTVITAASGTVAEDEISADSVTAVLSVNRAYAEYSAKSEDETENKDRTPADEADTAADADAINSVSDDSSSSTGLDLNSYVTSANFQKKNGNMWVDSTEFTTSDQARGTINFENIYTSELEKSGNTVYIDLPAGIDCSRFTGEYDTYDGGTHSGKYHYEKNSDGSYRIVLKLDSDYVEKAGDIIGGSLQFQFYWDAEKIPSGGKVPIQIGDYSGEVTVKKSEDSGGDSSSANYHIEKSAGGVTYSDDGKTAYIDYTITLTVKNTMSSPITMKDILSGKGFTYDTGYGVKATDADGKTVDANYGTTSGEGASTQIQLWTGNPGKYTIKYRVKTLPGIDASEPGDSLDTQVNNKVVVPEDGKDQTSAQTWTSTTTGTVNKQGQLVTGSKGTYIDYTVYLNAGSIIKNLKTPANFTDTLPDTLELQGNVTVKQYDVKGSVVNTATAAVDGQNISYTTPTGQYYYIITYRTLVKNTEKLPIGNTVITNDGKSTGGIEGSSSSQVTVPNHVLNKAFSSQQIGKDSSDTWVNTMKWTSTINVNGSVNGYTYEDWSGLRWDSAGTVIGTTMTMSDAQRAAIVVKDASGNVVDSNCYTVSAGDHKNGETTDSLFKLVFTGEVTGPVTIEYETTADLTSYTDGVEVAFRNFSSLEKDGHYDYAQADSTKIMFRRQSKDYVHKYGSTFTVDSTGKIELEPGQNTITWTIQANESRTLHSNLVITDTIADGLTYVEDSLKVTEGLAYGKTVDTSYDASTRTLTIKIPADAYSSTQKVNPFSNAVIITYETKLPDSFFTGSDTSLTVKNTAKVEFDGKTDQSTFTQDVTRQVVGKSGSYDKVNKILSYNIVINPDGSALNSGSSLKVQDALSGQYDADKEVVKNVSLSSLDVYTAVKSTDSSGKVTVKPGAYVKTLTQVASNPSDFQYVYDDLSKTFTTYLPDKTAYVIVAKYAVDADVAGDVNLKNEVKITGQNEWSKMDYSTKITQDTAGETHTNKHTLVVAKHDLASYETMPSGAKFKLEQYKNGAWSDFSSTESTAEQATGSNGKASWYGIEFEVLYKLTETEPPTGYVLDSTPTYFVVVREANKDNLNLALPDGVSKDSVKIYTVKNNTSSKQYYANIEIDRYDAKDTSKVDPSEISVTKNWVDAKGNTITDSAQLANMPEITVTLTKHVPKSANTVTVVGDSNSATYSVNNGGYLVFKGISADRFYNGALENRKYTFSCTDSSVSAEISDLQSDNTYTVKVGPINGNCTITSSALYWDSCYNSKTAAEGGTAPGGTIDTTVGTVTLNAANNWYYLWKDLDISTSGVTYTITETAINGYTASYTVNGTDLQPGATFKPGITGDKVVITNTANPEYNLPESGGPGTTLFTAAGAALVGLGLFTQTLRRRRRRV